MQVLSRLAPFERGIYEDYVANFWCTTSVIVKWKRLFNTQTLRILSLVSTVSTCLPSMMLLILAPSRRNFLFGLLSSALSFYFFSFQGTKYRFDSVIWPCISTYVMCVSHLSIALIDAFVLNYSSWEIYSAASSSSKLLGNWWASYFSLANIFCLAFYVPSSKAWWIDYSIHCFIWSLCPPVQCTWSKRRHKGDSLSFYNFKMFCDRLLSSSAYCLLDGNSTKEVPLPLRGSNDAPLLLSVLFYFYVHKHETMEAF